jgi:hypothetical protein
MRGRVKDEVKDLEWEKYLALFWWALEASTCSYVIICLCYCSKLN